MLDVPFTMAVPEFSLLKLDMSVKMFNNIILKLLQSADYNVECGYRNIYILMK